MSLCVVAIHVASGSCIGITFPYMFSWFIRLAVPFFFVTSGFLLARELSCKEDYEKESFLKVRTGKILKLFSLWLLIYLPISLICFPYGEKPLYKLVTSIIANVLIRGEIRYAWPLWFLYSLLLTTAGLWFTSRSRISRILFLIIVCLFYISGQILTLVETTNLPLYLQYLCKLLPIRAIGGGGYLLCGILIFKTYTYIAKAYFSILLIGISIVLHIFNLPCYEMIGGISIFLFATLLNIDKKRFSSSLRVQSMWIYYLHMYVIFILLSISKIKGIQLQLWPTYFTVLFITMLIAYILSVLQTKPRLKFLRILTK